MATVSSSDCLDSASIVRVDLPGARRHKGAATRRVPHDTRLPHRRAALGVGGLDRADVKLLCVAAAVARRASLVVVVVVAGLLLSPFAQRLERLLRRRARGGNRWGCAAFLASRDEARMLGDLARRRRRVQATATAGVTRAKAEGASWAEREPREAT